MVRSFPTCFTSKLVPLASWSELSVVWIKQDFKIDKLYICSGQTTTRFPSQISLLIKFFFLTRYFLSYASLNYKLSTGIILFALSVYVLNYQY